MKPAVKAAPLPPLPTGLTAADIVRPPYTTYDTRGRPRKQKASEVLVPYPSWVGNYPDPSAPPQTFELWYVTDWGWCMPTLLIRNPSRRSSQTVPRTYATRLKDWGTVTIGLGPHVTARVTVYVRVARLKVLQPYLTELAAGQVKAHQCRDRRSSRSAATSLRRNLFGRY